MTKTAWVFPGQGSQKIGMGVDLAEEPIASAKYEAAEKILGWSVPEICNSEDDKVSNSLYTQPTLYVVESILADLMRDRDRQPNLVAGHSLGEYVALYVAGVFDFETGLKLVLRRAELMSTVAGGQMMALIGFNREQLEEQIEQTADVVLANDNSDAQVVISGTPEAVEAVASNIKTKRAVKLNVSGAFHSPFMAPAAAEFQTVLDGVTFADAGVPVLSNTDPTPTTNGERLKQRLSSQMTGSVRWREIMQQFSEQNIETVVEVGPGKVLSNLIKRACSGISLGQVGTLANLPE
ncbi:ACP S-malonyltransferase [Phormidium sp. CCY1219]|uniref:ACP S-malonyltransferase n=1 Tax=Phormidium sp. CCY1219 TaxID=2886104 RepID=UPI002D1F33A3|nr:ACP S-malonyltransferase [Phormidium sp. CCY1219]MEB3829058.1 ACP S-malonyltransferase [Phormidium sp. CCY1219]